MSARSTSRVLYLSRDGVLDGLGESQILGYLEALADDYRFWLITFEKSMTGAAALRRQLTARGITWTPFAFAGRQAPLAAAWGLLRFAFRALRLVVVHRIRVIHARSYVPCAVALVVRAACFGYPRVIFDMRGFWVDERAEAGQWSPLSRAYRLGKTLERLLLRRSAAIVALTGAARREAARLRDGGSDPDITVIPTCVNPGRFAAASGSVVSPGPAPWRDRLVFLYMGAAGFWQDPEALAAFFAVVHQERPDSAFVCLLRTGAERMRSALARAGLAEASLVQDSVPAAEVPRWVAAAAVGVVWYRPTFSRIGNFPTKLGEYLAGGLPVLIAGATADSVDLVTRAGVGVVVRDLSPTACRDAIAEVVALTKDPTTAARCRGVAETELSVVAGASRYREIYRRLGAGAA